MVAKMAQTCTIDRAGRLVIPKALRESLQLDAGTRLTVTERDGELILSPERPEPRLVEESGYLVVETGRGTRIESDHRAAREERGRLLLEYALSR